PIVPVTAIPFEALRIGRGGCKLTEITTADDAAKRDCLFALPKKSPPQWNRLGSANDAQELCPSGKIAVEKPAGDFDEYGVFRQPHVADPCGCDRSYLSSVAG